MNKAKVWSCVSWLYTNCRFVVSRLNNGKQVKCGLPDDQKMIVQ